MRARQAERDPRQGEGAPCTACSWASAPHPVPAHLQPRTQHSQGLEDSCCFQHPHVTCCPSDGPPSGPLHGQDRREAARLLELDSVWSHDSSAHTPRGVSDVASGCGFLRARQAVWHQEGLADRRRVGPRVMPAPTATPVTAGAHSRLVLTPVLCVPR